MAPLSGIRVVEVAGYVFVPLAGAVLADLGAEVVKVEPPGGDPMRAAAGRMGAGADGSITSLGALVELANRGKRSVVLDLRTDEGHDALLRLVEGADVFLTSNLPSVRAKLRIEPDDLRAVNPRLVYAHGSGWGSKGAMRDTPAFDMTSAWTASGTAHWFGLSTGELPQQPYGFYDTTAGHALAGAVGFALLQRERTGEAPVVDVSLLNVGWWPMQGHLAASRYAPDERPFSRRQPTSPLVNWYRTADDRWILLSASDPRWWPDLCARLDRADLVDDVRFASAELRGTNAAACADALAEAFSRRTLADWSERLEGFVGAWGPVLTPVEAARHPQAAANGFIADVATRDGVTFPAVAAPVQFDGAPTERSGPMPAVGEHTREVLRELGYDDGAIEAMAGPAGR